MQAGRQAGRPGRAGKSAGAAARALREDVACGHGSPPVARALLRTGLAGFPCRIGGQMMDRECDLLAATPAAPGARRGRGAHAGASARGGAAGM